MSQSNMFEEPYGNDEKYIQPYILAENKRRTKLRK